MSDRTGTQNGSGGDPIAAHLAEHGYHNPYFIVDEGVVRIASNKAIPPLILEGDGGSTTREFVSV